MDTSDEMVPLTSTPAKIMCCLCGELIEANPSNMCVNCIRSQVDITESIPKQSSVFYCRHCARYLNPPKHWIAAELESKELLTLCLKRLKGLNKVKLVDAGFRWTEPHSRRIHLRLKVQKEVFHNTILQQEFIVEFVVEYQQCEMCTRDAADVDEWTAVVQARQKVPHKRTFLYLEQLILKHNAHEDAVAMKLFPDGMDFYFFNRSQALKFISFLNHVVPVRYKTSEHLVSHDANSNTYRYKYTFSTELVPICKDDLVCLPPKLSNMLGGIGPIVLVTRVSQSITVIDPLSLATAEISSPVYWKYPFRAMMSVKQATEYTIIDIDNSDHRKGKYILADATVARSSDYGRNDNTTPIRTHLGNLLNPGDLALGFDVANAVYNEGLVVGYKRLDIPDVLLFKKTYEKRNRSKRRKWRLQRLNMELDDSLMDPAMRRRGGVADPHLMMQQEQEEFMQEIEQDQEMRSTINLFKSKLTLEDAAMPEATEAQPLDPENLEDGLPEEDYPEVGIEELLDGLVIEDGETTEATDADTPSNADLPGSST